MTPVHAQALASIKAALAVVGGAAHLIEHAVEKLLRVTLAQLGVLDLKLVDNGVEDMAMVVAAPRRGHAHVLGLLAGLAEARGGVEGLPARVDRDDRVVQRRPGHEEAQLRPLHLMMGDHTRGSDGLAVD